MHSRLVFTALNPNHAGPCQIAQYQPSDFARGCFWHFVNELDASAKSPAVWQLGCNEIDYLGFRNLWR